MAETDILVCPEALQEFATAIFERAGLDHPGAAFYAKSLVDTNLWGIDSHGVLRLPLYARRLLKKAMNPQPQIRTLRGSMGLEVIHGDDGPGPVVGRAAMERAIALAQQYNVGVVGAIHSNHFGAAATYARLAVAQGLIGIAMTNVTQNVVAPGGSKPVVGNNPFAVGIPTYGEFPFVLDISLSAVAGGKLLLASKKGEKIPLDWATDTEGRPTDDPAKAFAGFLLPVGGYKGLGLAYVVDILSGLITGGVFLDQMKGMYKFPDDPSLTCHLMIAINVSAIMSPDELKARMAAFQQKVKASPMWAAGKEMLIPGEIEHRMSLARQAQGIPLPAKLFDELLALGQELGVSQTLPRMAA